MLIVSWLKNLPSLPPPSSIEHSTTGTEKQRKKPAPKKKSLETKPRITDVETLYENGPIARKEEVSAEVPKFGVSAESQRTSHIEITTFKKDKE